MPGRRWVRSWRGRDARSLISKLSNLKGSAPCLWSTFSSASLAAVGSTELSESETYAKPVASATARTRSSPRRGFGRAGSRRGVVVVVCEIQVRPSCSRVNLPQETRTSPTRLTRTLSDDRRSLASLSCLSSESLKPPYNVSTVPPSAALGRRRDLPMPDGKIIPLRTRQLG